MKNEKRKILSWQENILGGFQPYLLIAMVIFLIYFQTLFFDFSYLDDNSLILDNAGFIGNLGNFFQAFREDVFLSFADAYYRPIMTISLMLDAQFSGTHPFFFHFSNLAIHILAACLVFSVLAQMKYRRDVSLFLALVFAVHPVLSQTVAWIPGRNDSLLAVFVLAGFWYFLKFLETRNKKYLVGNLIFFTLGVFTKETAVMLPVVEAVYLFFLRKDKKFIFNEKWIWIGSGGVAIIWFLMRRWAFINPIEMPLCDLVFSVWKNSPAMVQFLGKIFFPFNLSVLPIIEDTTFWLGSLAIIIWLSLLFFTKEKKWAAWVFGAFWFLVFLLPSFVRPNAEIVADFIEHRLYLPIFGLFIILLETDWLRRYTWEKKIWLWGSAIFLIFLSGMTFWHSRNFQDRMSFWQDARTHSPHSPLAHRNLGAMLFLDGKFDQAEPEFQEALRLNPSEQMAHNNLGLIYMKRGEMEKSELEFKKELEINPFYDAAHFNLGLLYYQLSRKDEAGVLWQKTLEINYNYGDAWRNLAILYYEKKNLSEATKFAKEAYLRGVQLPPELIKLLEVPTVPGMLLKK